MANKRAKRAYKMAEGGIIPAPPPIPGAGLLKQATGALAGRGAAIDKAVDAAANSGVSGASSVPSGTATPPSSPTTTAIIPGLADQMAARQAMRVKAEASAEAARQAEAAKPKGILSRFGFADGGKVDKQPMKGLRGYAKGGFVPPFNISAASEPWAQDAAGEYENDDWARGGTGSISQRRINPELQQHAQERYANDRAAQFAHFADGGQLGAASALQGNVPTGLRVSDKWEGGGTTQGGPVPYNYHPMPAAGTPPPDYHNPRSGASTLASGAFGMRNVDGGDAQRNAPPGQYNPRHTQDSGDFGMGRRDASGQQHPQRGPSPAQYGLYANGGYVYDTKLDNFGNQVMKSTSTHTPRGQNEVRGYAEGGPVRSGLEQPGVSMMNSMGTFSPVVNAGYKPWTPDTPEKMAAYTGAAAANQKAGSTIGGQDIASHVRQENRMGGSTAAWNTQPGATSVNNTQRFSGMSTAGPAPAGPGLPKIGSLDNDQVHTETDPSSPWASMYKTPQHMGATHFADGGNVPPVTRARAVANDIEEQRMSPALNKVGPNSAFTVPALALDAARAAALGRKERTPEEMDELTREAGRGVRGMADGGRIPLYTHGGRITGKGGPTGDEQPILASPGEFVIPADTAKQIGTDKLQSLVDQTHTPVNKQGLRGLNFSGDTGDQEVGRLRGAWNALTGKAGATAKQVADAAKQGSENFRQAYESGTWRGEPAAQAADGTATAEPIPGGKVRGYTAAPATMEEYANTAYAAKNQRGIAGRATTPPEPIMETTPRAPLVGEGAPPIESAPKSGWQAKAGAWGKPVSFPNVAPAIAKTAGFLGKTAAYAAPVVEGLNYARDKPFLDQLEGGTAAAGSRAGWRLGLGGLGAAAGTAAGGLTGPGAAVASPVLGLAGGIGGYNLGDWAARQMNPQLDLAENLRTNQEFIDQKKAQIAERRAKGETVDVPPQVAPAQQAAQAQPEDTTYNDIMQQAAARANTDTAAPPKTIDETNAAARAQMKSMDADNIQKDRLESLRLEQMRGAGDLATRKYELDQAAQTAKRFPNDPGVQKDLGLKAAMYQDATQGYRGGLAQQGAAMEAPMQREQQTSLANLAAKTHMDEARMGLRGQEYGKNVDLASHLADRRLQLYRMQYEMADKNTGEREKYINEHPSVMDPVLKDGKPTGEYKANPTKVAALRQALRNQEGTPNALQPTSSWLPYADAAGIRAGLNKPLGAEAPPTTPTKAEYKPMQMEDWGMLHPPGAARGSTVGAGDLLKSMLPAGVVGAQAGKTVTLHNVGSRPITVPASEYQDALDKDSLADLIAKYSKEQAKQYRADTRIPK